jgi:hypothetical protein
MGYDFFVDHQTTTCFDLSSDSFDFPTSTSQSNLSPVLIAFRVTAQRLSETTFYRVAGIRGRTSVHAESFLSFAYPPRPSSWRSLRVNIDLYVDFHSPYLDGDAFSTDFHP